MKKNAFPIQTNLTHNTQLIRRLFVIRICLASDNLKVNAHIVHCTHKINWFELNCDKYTILLRMPNNLFIAYLYTVIAIYKHIKY